MSCSNPGNRYDLLINQGADFVQIFTYKASNGTPINLSGYTARMMIKNSPEDDTALVTLTTENGRIALGGALGTITLSLTNAVTAALDFTNALYDLEIVSGGGFVTRLVTGAVTLSPEITK